MYKSVVNYSFKNVFLTFYVLQTGLQTSRARGNSPLLSLSTGLGALITR